MLYDKNIKCHPDNMIPCAENGAIETGLPEKVHHEDLAATGGLFGYMDEHNIDTAPCEDIRDNIDKCDPDNGCPDDYNGGPTE